MTNLHEWSLLSLRSFVLFLATPHLQPRPRHPFTQPTVSQEITLQTGNLPIQQIGRQSRQTENHIRTDLWILVFDPASKGRVIRDGLPIQFPQSLPVRMTGQPFIQATCPQKILVINRQFFQTGPPPRWLA